MGFLDKFFVPEESPDESVKGGTRELLKAQNVPNYDEKVNISGNAAEEILKNALAPLEGKQTTIYTLKELVAQFPTGTKKEHILGVMKVAKVSEEEIKADAQERINILQATEKKLQEKVTGDISQFDAEIKEAENKIEENRKKKAEAEELLRNFKLLESKTIDEVKNILSTIE